MDVTSLLRMVGALAVVLGMMAGALWAVRRFDIRLPGRVGGSALRRTEVVERTAIDARRSVALFRRDGREHLILLTPEGNTIIEAGIVRDEIDLAAEAQRKREAEERRQAQEEAMAATRAEMDRMRASFAELVEANHAKARASLTPHVRRAAALARQGAARARTAARQGMEAARKWRAATQVEEAPAPIIALLPPPTPPRLAAPAPKKRAPRAKPNPGARRRA